MASPIHWLASALACARWKRGCVCSGTSPAKWAPYIGIGRKRSLDNTDYLGCADGHGRAIRAWWRTSGFGPNQDSWAAPLNGAAQWLHEPLAQLPARPLM